MPYKLLEFLLNSLNLKRVIFQLMVETCFCSHHINPLKYNLLPLHHLIMPNLIIYIQNFRKIICNIRNIIANVKYQKRQIEKGENEKSTEKYSKIAKNYQKLRKLTKNKEKQYQIIKNIIFIQNLPNKPKKIKKQSKCI